MGCKFSKKKYSNYEIVDSKHNSTINTYDLALKLEDQFSSLIISQKDDDVFEEITFEIVKQRKTLKNENLLWIPYNQFDNILYHSKNVSGIKSEDYSAIWRDGKTVGSNKTKDWKVLLKELDNSSHMTQDDLKLNVAELECNRKKNLVEVFGITQNPETLNYIIVMDYLFSGN